MPIASRLPSGDAARVGKRSPPPTAGKAALSAPESSSYGCTRPSWSVRYAELPSGITMPLVPLSPGKRWASRNRSSSVNVPNSVDHVRGVSASR